MKVGSTTRTPPARPVASDAFVISTLVLVGVIAVAPVMLSVGTSLKWHFSVNTAVQGGIELAVLWLALALAVSSRMSLRWRAVSAAMLAGLYLRRHHVDLPLLVVVLYVEGLIACGALLRGIRGAQSVASTVDEVVSFLLGTITFGLVIWTASALGFGLPGQLAVIAVVVLGVSAALARRKPLTLQLTSRWLDPVRTPAERWLGAAIVVWFLSLCARTNNIVCFDSLWYGLRLPHVLVGERSMYESLGLVSPVYYFPKLYESLMLPLAGFGDFSFQFCLTIAVLGMMAILAASFLRRNGFGTSYALIGAVTLITIPACSNLALSAKPDLFAAMLLLGAALAAWSVSRGADARELGWVYGLVVLAACAKINTAPYGGAILVAGVLGALWRSRATKGFSSATHAPVLAPEAGSLVVVLSTVLAGFVTARTGLLAGVPTIGPEQLVSLWNTLGMEVRPPAGTLKWTSDADWAGVPQLVFDYLFRPDDLRNVVTTWVGNVWAALAVAGAAIWLGGSRAGQPPVWVWWPVMLVGLWLALGTQFMVRGGDGNYFLLPVALATLLSLAWVGRLTLGTGRRTANALFAILIAISAWQASYAFVSAAWSQPGTRTWDLRFGRSPTDTPRLRAGQLAYYGLAEIEAFLRTQRPTTHVVGAGDELGMNWLSARVESLATISYSYPRFVADETGFRTFLRLAKVDYLLVPVTGGEPDESELAPGVRRLLASFDWRRSLVVSNGRFALIDVIALAR